MQKLAEANLQQIFGLDLVSSEFELKGQRIDTLAFDKDSNAFAIIEYKKDKNISVSDQGMSYLYLMLNNKSDLIVEYNKRTSGKWKTNFDWEQSRVLFVAPRFTIMHQNAINFTNVAIQLWEIRKYKNGIVTFNEVQSPNKKESIKTIIKNDPVTRRVSKEIKVYTEGDHLSKVNVNVKELYGDLRSAILGLGNDIEVRPKKFYIAFRRKQSFAGLLFLKSKLKVYLTIDFPEIEDPLKKARDVKEIGHYSNGNTEVTIMEPGEIPYLLTLIKHAYDRQGL